MMGQQSEAGWRRRCDDDDDADEEALEWEFKRAMGGIDGELEAAGMRRMIFDEPEALAAPRGSVQRVFKEQQNRGKESFKIKCWAAADLQWVGGQWSGLVPPEYNEFRIYLQYKCFSFFCIYFFLNAIISIQQPFGKKRQTSQRSCQSLTESPRRRKKFSLRKRKSARVTRQSSVMDEKGKIPRDPFRWFHSEHTINSHELKSIPRSGRCDWNSSGHICRGSKVNVNAGLNERSVGWRCSDGPIGGEPASCVNEQPKVDVINSNHCSCKCSRQLRSWCGWKGVWSPGGSARLVTEWRMRVFFFQGWVGSQWVFEWRTGHIDFTWRCVILSLLQCTKFHM